MDNICYFIKVQFRICQSGVPISSEKIYTNVSENTVIQLYYGYTIQLSNASNNEVNILIANSALNLSFNITVSNGETLLLDLPLDNGTFRLSLVALARCCAQC